MLRYQAFEIVGERVDAKNEYDIRATDIAETKRTKRKEGNEKNSSQ